MDTRKLTLITILLVVALLLVSLPALGRENPEDLYPGPAATWTAQAYPEPTETQRPHKTPNHRAVLTTPRPGVTPILVCGPYPCP